MAAFNSHKIKIIFVLLLTLLVGATLRWFNLEGSTSFFYDQGRDALKAVGILQGDYVLVGPSADTTGLFMGPLWYYVLAVLYWLGNGNPIFALIAISLLDLATILLIFVIGIKFYGTRAGLLASIFWSYSAVSVAYARTLSNPSTTAFWTLLTVLSIIKIHEGKKFFVLVLSLSQIIMWQLNPAAAFLFTPAILVCFVFLWDKIRAHKRIWTIGLLMFLLSWIPQILFEIRNQFPSFDLAAKIFTSSGPKEGYIYGVNKRFFNFQFELSNYTFYKQFLISTIAFIVSVTISFKLLKNRKFFLTFSLVPLIVFLFLYPRGESHPHYLLAWVPFAVLALSFAASTLSRIHGIFLVVILSLFLYTNYFGLHQEIIVKDHIAQPADPNFLSLGDQLRVVDYVYQDAKGNDFGYHSYNILPYWADENWQYLFMWHGKQKYGFTPKRREGNPMYVIYEPDPFLPELQKSWLKKITSGSGTLIQRKSISLYKIEKYEK